LQRWNFSSHVAVLQEPGGIPRHVHRPRARAHRLYTPASAGAIEEYKMDTILWIVLAAVVVFAALYVAKNDPFGINPK
jgi:hypothetical protein